MVDKSMIMEFHVHSVMISLRKLRNHKNLVLVTKKIESVRSIVSQFQKHIGFWMIWIINNQYTSRMLYGNVHVSNEQNQIYKNNLQSLLSDTNFPM